MDSEATPSNSGHLQKPEGFHFEAWVPNQNHHLPLLIRRQTNQITTNQLMSNTPTVNFAALAPQKVSGKSWCTFSVLF